MAAADPLPPFRPHATYQGVPCVSWRVARTVGVESDAYEVVLPATALGGLRIPSPREGLYAPIEAGGDDKAPSGDGAKAREGGAPPHLGGELAVRGDLVMSDGRGSVTLGLYLRDDGVEIVDAGGDPDDLGPTQLARIHLVDIRYWWSRRGELWGTYNVLRPDGSYDPSTTHGHGEGAGGGTVVRGAGDPFSLAEILALILDRLPGRPRLVRSPDLTKIVPVNLRWQGILPKAELERLLEAYGLTLALTPKNEIEITDATEQAPTRGKTGDARKLGGADLIAGAWWRTDRATHRHRPEAVRIVGPASIREVRVSDLEMVGYARPVIQDGQPTQELVSARDAAASYGLTVATVGALATQSPRVRERFCREMGLGKGAASEIASWAFRLFRLPAKALGFLPLLSERATTYVPQDGDGERRGPLVTVPPLVEADVYVESSYTAEELRAARTQAAGDPGASGGQGGGGADGPASDSGDGDLTFDIDGGVNPDSLNNPAPVADRPIAAGVPRPVGSFRGGR